MRRLSPPTLEEPPFPKAPIPSLILLDLNLPGRDGHDVLAELRSLEPYHTTPVVVLRGGSLCGQCA